MTKPGDIALRLADDDDLLAKESKLDDLRGGGMWPRSDKQHNALRSWDEYHQSAMNHLSRNLRSRKSTAEPFEIGRLDARSKANLREPAAYLALHFLFVDADNSGDSDLFARKAAHYWELGNATLDAESVSMDYDTDNSGTIDDTEKNQPMPSRFIRG